jgi:hypothetical protein
MSDEFEVICEPHPEGKSLLMGYGKDWKHEIGPGFYYCPYGSQKEEGLKMIEEKEGPKTVVVTLSDEQMEILATKIAEKTLSFLKEEEDRQIRKKMNLNNFRVKIV